MYSVKIPKILFLALDIARFYKKSYYNTNDLSSLSNKHSKKLVRLRKDKKDYKYLDDTERGGLRGNFSTLLTWKGIIKKGTSVVNIYNVGRDDRLVNAVVKGDIILSRRGLTANTNDKKLKELLELESWLLTVRETQAHIKSMLERNKSIPLKRDSINFPKESVVVSSKGQYFVRSLLNNYMDTKNEIIEYNITNLWSGKKFKNKNIHLLVVIPSKDNPWDKIYAIKNEDLYRYKPLVLHINIRKMTCSDIQGNEYTLYPLDQAIDNFSGGDENIQARLDYDWKELRNKALLTEVESNKMQESEFSVFVRLFLKGKYSFSIEGKEVVDVIESSSGGPDVTLVYSGGTKQKLELEHKWKSYIDHKHHTNNAWSGVWIFSEEKFDEKQTPAIFRPFTDKYKDNIPGVFLCISGGERAAYRINWESNTAEQIKIDF